MCGQLFISARLPGQRRAAAAPTSSRHARFRDAVSVVVPCHNEAMNVAALVTALRESYDPYLKEIVLVDDNSVDDTAAVCEALAAQDAARAAGAPHAPGAASAARCATATPRPPASSSSRWTATSRCSCPSCATCSTRWPDGCDGAIGSRFSHDSVLLNYPAGKLLGNRAFHALVRLLVRRRIRDVSNNLKLYRGDLLRDLEITQDGFAANAETGLAPILAGADIREVPIAWINREAEMGVSSFKVLRVAPGYAIALARMLATARRAVRDRPGGGRAPTSTIVNHSSGGRGDPSRQPSSGGTP